jgi:alkylation response protein AidB-like acyl-CoA dehydrogenase
MMRDDESKPATFREVIDIMLTTRMFQGARALGLAQAAFEAALDYSKERIVFGKPIALYQYNSFRLAEMATRIEAARWLVYYAAWLYDQGAPSLKANCMAKYYANDTAVHCARDAKELFGGYGHIMDFSVSHYLGDALVGETGEGTAEIQKMTIARELGLIEPRG